MNRHFGRIGLPFLALILIMGCSSSQLLSVDNLKSQQAVNVVKMDGTSEKVVIVRNTGKELVYVSATDHKEHRIALKDIRRVEPLNTYYDDLAYPISAAEIQKNKSSKNTWSYALGGAVIGGAGGLAIALPFWYADVGGIPPYFVAGAGAVAGSIYFGYVGQKKDKNLAIDKIRMFRKVERELQQKVQKEKEELDKLNREKQQLEKKLHQKEQKNQ